MRQRRAVRGARAGDARAGAVVLRELAAGAAVDTRALRRGEARVRFRVRAVAVAAAAAIATAAAACTRAHATRAQQHWRRTASGGAAKRCGSSAARPRRWRRARRTGRHHRAASARREEASTRGMGNLEFTLTSTPELPTSSVAERVQVRLGLCVRVLARQDAPAGRGWRALSPARAHEKAGCSVIRETARRQFVDNPCAQRRAAPPLLSAPHRAARRAVPRTHALSR